MWELLELVLTKIEIKSKATQSLRDQVLNIRNRPDKAELLLNELIEDRETSNCTKCDSRHFCALFLACIYFEFDDVDQMQIYIQESIKDFSHAGSKWNKILARWIYGTILLRKNRSLSARRELEDTVEMLEEMEKEFRSDVKPKHEKSDECKAFIDKIRSQLKRYEQHQKAREKIKSKNKNADSKSLLSLSRRSVSSPKSASKSETGPAKTGLKEDQAEEPPPPKKSEPQGGELRPLHITIPINVRVKKEYDYSSTFLDPELYEQFRTVRETVSSINVQENKKTPKKQKDTENYSSEYIIPSFYIYGYAAAGPQGEPMLPPPDDSFEKASAVTETLQIDFEGKPYKVFIPKRKSSEKFKIKGNKYGWCKAKGMSMNNSPPIPIDNNDYILFCHDEYDLDHFKGNIVVSTLPSSESPELLFVIKRLITRTSAKHKTESYLLISEPINEIDPVTNQPYNEIEIFDRRQIVGNVVVIAKPLKSTQNSLS